MISTFVLNLKCRRGVDRQFKEIKKLRVQLPPASRFRVPEQNPSHPRAARHKHSRHFLQRDANARSHLVVKQEMYFAKYHRDRIIQKVDEHFDPVKIRGPWRTIVGKTYISSPM